MHIRLCGGDTDSKEEIMENDINNNISALRIMMQDCYEAPRLNLAPHKPHMAIDEQWIPQTMGDQVWVTYTFKTEEDRIDWEMSLPDHILKWLDRTLIPHALKFIENRE